MSCIKRAVLGSDSEELTSSLSNEELDRLGSDLALLLEHSNVHLSRSLAVWALALFVHLFQKEVGKLISRHYICFIDGAGGGAAERSPTWGA